MSDAVATPAKEPDELDKAIEKRFPHAAAATRAEIKARAQKHGQRMQKHDSKKVSVLVQLQSVPDVDTLDALRQVITSGLAHDKVAGKDFIPSQRTVETWAQAQWDSVFRLMFGARRCGDLCYIYNVVRKWPKPDFLALQIDSAFKFASAKIPNDTQLLYLAGIELEGITPSRAFAELFPTYVNL